MAVEPLRQHEGPDGPEAGPIRVVRPGESPEPDNSQAIDASATDLLVYGTDEILKGTDMGTLVAFAALAFQQIRGKGEPHHGLGCSLLLVSVMMCAVVHLAIGNAYVGRAKLILKRRELKRRHHLVRVASYGTAWIAALGQFITLMLGLFLVLMEKPPALLMKYLKPFLQV
jgi:hypothetical protein